jgi:hypothetical protein
MEMLFANDPRLRLSHHEIMAQGESVDKAKEAVRNAGEHKYCLEDLNGATGCRGKSTPITLLTYTDAYTFIEYHVAHCMALGLHSQIGKQMRDVIGYDAFNSACKRAAKRDIFLFTFLCS